MQGKTKKVDLYFAASGQRTNFPALVFLHYFGGSGQSWREVIEQLEKDFFCIAPDLRGFGKSPQAENYEIEAHAQDIIDLTAQLELENYVLIGHSMGGKIAAAVAAEQPKNLLSLILFAPSPPSPEPMKDSDREKMLTTHGTPHAAEETILNGVNRKLSVRILAEAIEANLQTHETAWKWWLESGSRRNIAPLTKKIKIPVFAAVGKNDENMTAELIEREIVSRVQKENLTIIENAKHLLPLEAPNETAETIRRAVEKIPAFTEID